MGPVAPLILLTVYWQQTVPTTYPHPFVLLIWEACSSVFYVYWFHYIRDLLCFWSANGCLRNKYSLSLVIYRLFAPFFLSLFTFAECTFFSYTVLSVSPDPMFHVRYLSDRLDVGASSALYA